MMKFLFFLSLLFAGFFLQADVIFLAEGTRVIPVVNHELSQQIEKLCLSCAADFNQLGGGGISILQITKKKKWLWGFNFEYLSSQRSSSNEQDFVSFSLNSNLVWFNLGWERKGKNWNQWFYIKYLLGGDLKFIHDSSFISNSFEGHAKLLQGYGLGIKLNRKINKKLALVLGIELNTFQSGTLLSAQDLLLADAVTYLASNNYQNTYLATSLGLGYRF